MSVINRIEISNFLNLDNRRPTESEWQPHWRHVVINLRGQSGAIVATNGLGKSTANKALYALLSRDRKYVSDTRERAAPKRRGLWSHVRVEVLYQNTSDIIQPGLIGEDVPGDAYVFGLYGFSDDELRFYTYRGYLEACPVAHIHGHRRQMVANAEFQSALKNCSGLLHHPSTADWKQQIHRHFDPSLIHQLLLYQKAGGGDGAENFFKVKKADGEDYDSAFFYAHIAPEVLVNCMDVYGEEGEYRFEDTLLESAYPILEAQHRAEESARTVQACRSVFEGLQTAKQKADDYSTTQQSLLQTVASSLAEAVFLKEVVENHPLPGIPQPLRGQSVATAFVADRMVCCDCKWLIPDKVLAEVLSSEAKIVNREAAERKLSHTVLKISQLLEKPGHLGEIGRQQVGGATNHGYDLEAALGLIRNRQRFAQGWDADSIERALNDAFEWHEHAGEPNPLRLAAKVLQRSQDQLQARIAQHRTETATSRKEYDGIQVRLNTVQVSEHALSVMRRSNLFTADELAAPAATHLVVEEHVSTSRQARETHSLKHVALETSRQAYQAVCAAFPEQTPDEVQTNLINTVDYADEQWKTAQQHLGTASQWLNNSEIALQQRQLELGQLQATNSSIVLLLPAVRAFEASFPGESPIGLQESVQQALADAEQHNAQVHAEHSCLETEHAQIADLLPDVTLYRQRFTDEDPRQLSETVVLDLANTQASIKQKEEQRHRSAEQLEQLEFGHQATIAVQQRFGLETVIPQLERTLTDEFALCSQEKDTLDNSAPALRAQVAVLDAFEARFGGRTDARAIYHERRLRLPECGRQRDMQRQKLDALEQQRQELETVGTVAGKIAREVLACVGAAEPRLYQVVEALNLPSARRTQVLTHFSHLLHFPVLEDLEAAEAALNTLESMGLEAPLFVRDGLEQYCKHGNLTLHRGLVSSFMVGASTLQVRALINPEEIKLLKAHVDNQIAKLTPQVVILEQEYAELSSDSQISILIQQAVDATDQQARKVLADAQTRVEWLKKRLSTLNEHLQDNVLQQIRTATHFLANGGETALNQCQDDMQVLMQSLGHLNVQLPNLQVRASAESRRWIRSAHRYLDAGGDVRYTELELLLQASRAALETLKARLVTLRERVSRLPYIQAAEEWEKLGGWIRANNIANDLELAQSTLAECTATVNEAKTSQDHARDQVDITGNAKQHAQLQLTHWQEKLTHALEYLANEGPAFDHRYPEHLEQLERALQAAQLRTRFDFLQAQFAVDAANDPDGQAQLIERRDHLQESIQRLEQTIQDDDALHAHQIVPLQTLQRNASDIDHAVISILQQWRHVHQLMQVIPPDLVASTPHQSPYLQSAKTLREELTVQLNNQDLEILPTMMGDLASDIANFPLNEHRNQLDQFQRQLLSHFKDLKRELQRITEQHGDQLSPNETLALSTDRPPEQVVAEVSKLYLHFERFLLSTEALHRKSEADVIAARQHLITSITGFTDSLEENFRLLKRVLDRRDSKGAAGLRVEGELIERGAVRDEIDSVIKEIDRALRRRQEDQAAGRRIDSEAEFNQNLKLQIRSSFYRTVFRAPKDSNASGPTVTFQHPQIAGGRSQRLSVALSTGQGNALALLVLTKLADFTLHRDALADADQLSNKRRLRASSTRVVIIDGLFSNLSNKKMIRDSLSVIRTLKGSFQLIGWIHNELYENDPELFPAYIALRRVGESQGFVLVEDGAQPLLDSGPHEGEVKPIELHADPLPKTDDGTNTAS